MTSAEVDLYQAILARRSVRRYERTPLEPEELAQVRAVIAGVRPLITENRYHVLLRDLPAASDLTAALGAYGRIANPPHVLVPYLLGDRHPLVDLGFRTEQIAVRLTALGLGSCFIGCLGREAQVRARFGLPPSTHVAALLVFGRPSGATAARAVNALVRELTGATRKLPAHRVFFDGDFSRPAAPPPDLAPLIEAARHAPSAVDAQPWRFLWRDGVLHLFVRRRNPRYGPGRSQSYRLHDGGVCMGNVALALEALGRHGSWIVYEDDEADLLEHPESLAPLAHLELERQ
ncbi:MAG: nitroreductase family protein [Anaerolineae bacterium]|nr:nitroreductase family protein [Anaerolineae bacterium]